MTLSKKNLIHMLSKVLQWVKKNVGSVVTFVLAIGLLFFKAKAKKQEAELAVSSANIKDSALEQKQKDLSDEVAKVQKQEKTEENQPHSVEENEEFLKKL
jgi:hypothetical protein